MPEITSDNLPTNNGTGGLLGVKLEHSISETSLNKLLSVLVVFAFVWGGVSLLGFMFKKMIEKQ